MGVLIVKQKLERECIRGEQTVYKRGTDSIEEGDRQYTRGDGQYI